MSGTDYDVVIVGAGSAGGVLATRLSEDPGRSVLLVEAGPDYGSAADGQPADVLDATSLVMDHDWGHTGRITQDVPLFAGRLVGGGSAVNLVMALRGQPADYDGWGAEGNPGWSFAEMLPFFRRAERDLDFGDRDWHGDAGPVPIRRVDWDEMIPAQQAFLHAAKATGQSFVEDHNAPDAVGVGRQPLNAIDGVRQSTALTYLASARDRVNLTIRSGSLVDRVVVENGRAVGIRLAGSAGTIRAREVILASGSYGSPAILLRSGIGPADELAGLGVPVTVELPGVGRNLHDHPLLRMRFATSEEPAPMWHQVMLTTRSDGGSGPVDLQLFPSGPAATDDGAVLTLLVALLQPYSRGRVRLTSPAPGAALDIVPGHLSHPGDLPRIVAGMRLARQIAATSPLSDHLDEEVWPGREIVDDDALASAATSAMNTYHHAAGTCRMGPADDPGAVVDARARVHGVAGLRVVDASIMPAITRANTNLPTLGLAERAAELITDDLR